VHSRFIVIPAVAAILSLRLFLYRSFSAFNLAEAAAGFGLIALLNLFSRSRIGLGDALLSAVIDLLLGFCCLVLAVFIASLSGVLFILLSTTWGKMSLWESIPFAPFPYSIAVLSFFASEKSFHYWIMLHNWNNRRIP
jgi:prepilin signal peptidase PulO-like enzyme (type II secretory pathway)